MSERCVKKGFEICRSSLCILYYYCVITWLSVAFIIDRKWLLFFFNQSYYYQGQIQNILCVKYPTITIFWSDLKILVSFSGWITRLISTFSMKLDMLGVLIFLYWSSSQIHFKCDIKKEKNSKIKLWKLNVTHSKMSCQTRFIIPSLLTLARHDVHLTWDTVAVFNYVCNSFVSGTCTTHFQTE